MAAIMTNWGYSVEIDGAALPPLVTAEEFAMATGNVMSSSTERISAVLAQVSQAVREKCGWHVAPVLECSWTGQGDGRLMILPCTAIRSVEGISIDGVELDPDGYEWDPYGLVRLIVGRFPDRWRSVEAEFTAGIADTGSLAAAVVQIASNALAATPGVREEHAGQVGTTYNQTDSGVSGGIRLLESDLALLAPYKITRGW